MLFNLISLNYEFNINFNFFHKNQHVTPFAYAFRCFLNYEMQEFNTYPHCIYDQKALLTKLEVKMALYSTNTEDLNSI